MKIQTKLMLITFALFAIALLFSRNVSAQQFRGLIVGEPSIEGEKVNSLVVEVDADPGETVTGSFVATHAFENESEPYTFYTRAKDFRAGETPGTAYNFDYSVDIPVNESLANWVTFEQESITISEYGEKQVVNFSITIPEDAAPGGKYTSLLLNATYIDPEQDNRNQVAVDANVGIHIFLTVDGEVNKSLELVDLYTAEQDGDRRWFFWDAPVKVIAVFEATGNTHVEPRGRFYIHKNADFSKYDNTYELNVVEEGLAKRQIILPGETRAFEIDWKKDHSWLDFTDVVLGKYNVTLQHDYIDETGETSTQPYKRIDFWVIPIWLILLVLLTVLAVSYSYVRYRVSKNKK
jgi:hypothetical protein